MDPILLTVEDGIARLRFNRPDRLNALDSTMSKAFLHAAGQIASDPSIRVVMLSGQGRAFVAGGDLADLRAADDRAKAARQLIDPVHAGLKIIRESGVLTMAVVQGAAAGAGMSLVLGSDFVVASDQASFSMAYIRVAASPDCGGSWALARLVGPRRALELALLGDTLSASAALQMGLINSVVPPEALDRAAQALAERLVKLPIAATLRTRQLLDVAFATSFEDHLDLERDAFVEGAAEPDFAEALDAWFERRPASFRAEGVEIAGDGI